MLYDSAVEAASGQYCHSLTLRRRWFETVQDYSKRKMTISKDKLIALSGLAHSYYEREGPSGASHETRKGGRRGKYAAGLWEADMPSALLWRTWSAQRPSDYWAPSWSWASVDGAISYDSQMIYSNMPYSEELSEIMRFRDGPAYPRYSSEYDFGAFCLKEIEIKPSSSDSMGAVSAGHITLTGLVAIAIIDKDAYTIFQSGSNFPYAFLRDQDCLVVGALLPDVPTEARPNNIYCLSIRDEQKGAMVPLPREFDREYDFERFEMVMGLGLTRIGGNENGKVFRRFGLVRWVRKDLFAGKEVSTIKII